jgi:hypothetical protein
MYQRAYHAVEAHFFKSFSVSRVYHLLALEHPAAREPPTPFSRGIVAFYEKYGTVPNYGNIDTGDGYVGNYLLVEIISYLHFGSRVIRFVFCLIHVFLYILL